MFSYNQLFMISSMFSLNHLNILIKRLMILHRKQDFIIIFRRKRFFANILLITYGIWSVNMIRDFNDETRKANFFSFLIFENK